MNPKNIICAFLLFASACFGQRQYTVTPVPSPTADNNYVVWVSDDGSTTVGWVEVGGTVGQCYSVKNGVFTPYPTPGLSCTVRAVNKNLQFAGSFGPAMTAYVNLNGTFDPFGSRLTGSFTQSRGINNLGDVVGVASTLGASSGYSFVYSGGKATVHPLNFMGAAINDNGDVAGSVTPTGNWDPNNCHVAIYRAGNIIDLGTVGGPAYSQQINSAGQVSGYFLQAGFLIGDRPVPQPFFYDGIGMQPISIAGAAFGGYADFMNDAGEVVGRYYPDNLDACTTTCNWTHRAFYYSNGTATDLNALLVNPPAGVVLRDVFYISKSGLILAGSPNTQGQGGATYLLTPVSTPLSMNGAITASPNPAPATGNGDAITTISWNPPSTVTWIEVHIGGPTGPLFASAPASGSAVTGPWVSNGMTFYLQDASNGSGSNSTTLGTVVVGVQ